MELENNRTVPVGTEHTTEIPPNTAPENNMEKNKKIEKSPLIDILLASYNGAKHIEAQIQSILDQTFTNFNLIISDDNSQDNTVLLVEKMAKLDSRIVLIKNSLNAGYIKNFERLLTASRGKYVMLSDQDDVWKRDKIERSLDFLKKTESDLIFTDLAVVDEELNIIHRSFNEEMMLHPEKIRSINDLFHRNHATGNTFLFRSEMREHFLPFIDLKNPDYIHDWYIFFESFYNGKVSYLNEVTVLYRQHTSNQIGLDTSKGENDSFCMFKDKRKKYIQTHYEFVSKLQTKHNDFHSYLNYIASLEKSKFINFRFISFLSYFKTESWTKKIKFMIVLHFPFLFAFCRKNRKK
jgi:glycosyltransferase involved in cell wall biosynthesis